MHRKPLVALTILLALALVASCASGGKNPSLSLDFAGIDVPVMLSSPDPGVSGARLEFSSGLASSSSTSSSTTSSYSGTTTETTITKTMANVNLPFAAQLAASLLQRPQAIYITNFDITRETTVIFSALGSSSNEDITLLRIDALISK